MGAGHPVGGRGAERGRAQHAAHGRGELSVDDTDTDTDTHAGSGTTSGWQQRIEGECYGNPSVWDGEGNHTGFIKVNRSSVFDRGETTYYMHTLFDGIGPLRPRLETPGADRPAVWVVGCDRAGGQPVDFQRTARAFDIYTSSMDEALDHLAFVGIARGPVGTLSVGPVTMRQCLVPGPDGLDVVLVESTHRRPSLLDHGAPGGPVPLFSQGHSVVWCVDRMDAEAALLAAAGLPKGMDLAFTEAEVSTYLDLPRSPVPIRMTMLADAAVDPLRLQLGAS